MKRSTYIWLIVLFFAILSVRFYFTFTNDGFSSVDSYFTLRHSEHIMKTGLPMYFDDLSYGGRQIFYPPFFYYLTALMLFLGNFFLLAVPQILFSSLIIILFFIVHSLTKDEEAALIASFVATTSAVLLFYTLNTLEPAALGLPLFFLSMLLFMKTKQKKLNVYYYLTTFVIFTLSSTFVFLFVAALFFYFIVARLESKKISKSEVELFIFSFFFSSWFYVLLYKKYLLVNNFSVIWSNIPSEIFSTVFSRFSIIETLPIFGLFSALIGAYYLYRITSEKYRKNNYLVPAGIILIIIMLFFRLIELKYGIIFLSIFFSLLLGHFFTELKVLLEKTKFSKYSKTIFLAFAAIVIVVHILPSLFVFGQVEPVFSSEEESALVFTTTLPENAVIIAPYDYGHLITYFGKRKNVYDNNFLMIEDPSRYIKDTELLYTTSNEITALELLDKYNADYIFVTPSILNDYNVDHVEYLNDKRCFDMVYDKDGIQLFLKKCHVSKKFVKLPERYNG